MKKHLSFAFATILLATSVAAQPQSTTVPPSSGVLGQRYAEISGSASDPHGSSDFGFGGTLAANVPLGAGLDLGFGYGYSRTRTEFFSGLLEQRGREHVLGTSVTAYTTYQGVKPFAEAALGYSWAKDKLSFAGTTVLDDRDDAGLWGLAVGVEIPFGAVTFTPRISYQDDFKSGSARITSPTGPGTGSGLIVSGGGRGGAFDYGTEAHVWFTRAVGGFAEISYSDPTGGGTQSWTYAVGARLRF